MAAFGQLLQKPLLETVLCLNVHASLLPNYRGAAPIERALAAGESTTGVSIMRISEGLDEGPWAQQVTVSIGPRDDAGSLGRILAVAGAVAMAEVLDSIDDGTVEWTEPEGHAFVRGQAGTAGLLAGRRADCAQPARSGALAQSGDRRAGCSGRTCR